MDLFDASKSIVSEHICNIVAEGELAEAATVRKIRIVRQEGARQVGREVLHYNLDMAISVGYRVTSFKATQFRMWATSVLREYLVKGFVMNDACLKVPEASPYFEKLLARIRDIRASEMMFYLTEDELKSLNRLTTMFLGYDDARKRQETQAAERQAAQEFVDLTRHIDAINNQR